MYRRPIFSQLLSRVTEPRAFIQLLIGPRQVGKTTLVRQLEKASKQPFLYVSADQTDLQDRIWIETQWQRARNLCQEKSSAILVIDEVQKISNWSEVIKSCWDEDSANGIPLKVLLLGSSPLLMKKGTTESLAGRFEAIYVTHWSFQEMKDCFQFELEDFLFFGGYPGGVQLKNDPQRWQHYIRESLIETTVSQDILSLTRVDKPALLKKLLFLSCDYAGQVLSFTKMMGQLQDAGNTTTLAHYLDLLTSAGLVTGLQKWSPKKVITRSSSPKLIALNPALISAMLTRSQNDFIENTEFRGRLVENLVGAHLWNSSLGSGMNLYYWNEGNEEVDYILTRGNKVLAIEVKSGKRQTRVPALRKLCNEFSNIKPLIVGTGGVPLEEFLLSKPLNWF
jgi:predicted AAA+ superfamily ATPase